MTTPIPIGETEALAKRIFFSNEARISRQPNLAKEYLNFMQEYETLEHMERVNPTDINNRQRIYLPHHATIKATNQTTKVRVVFNASKNSSNNTSLNDHLLVGPKLQTDLFALIMRWRCHKYVYHHRC